MSNMQGDKHTLLEKLTSDEYDFPEVIASFLTFEGRNHTWFAKRLGVSKSTVSRWLNRQSAIPNDLSTLQRMTNLLNLDEDQTRLFLEKADHYRFAKALGKVEFSATQNSRNVSLSPMPKAEFFVDSGDREGQKVAKEIAEDWLKQGFTVRMYITSAAVIIVVVVLSILASPGARETTLRVIQKVIHRIIDILPDLPPAPAPESAEEFYERGVFYMDEGRLELAIDDFTRAIELDPEMAKAYDQRGHAYIALNEPALAMADSMKFNQFDPDKQIDTSGELSIVTSESQRGGWALSTVNDASPDENNPSLYADRLTFESDYQVTQEGYTETLRLDPTTYHVMKALSHMESGELPLAQTEFETAISLNTNPVLVYGTRGDWFFAQHNYFSAIQDYTKIIELPSKVEDLPEAYRESNFYRKDMLQAYIQRGRSYYYSDEKQRALDDFESAIAIEPTFADGHYAICLFSIFMGQPTINLGHCNRAVEIEPRQSYRDVRAISLAFAGDYEGALKDIWAYRLGDSTSTFSKSMRGFFVFQLSRNINPFENGMATVTLPELLLEAKNITLFDEMISSITVKLETESVILSSPICSDGKPPQIFAAYGYVRQICDR